MKETSDIISFTWRKQSASELLTEVGEWLEAHQHLQGAMEYYEAASLINPSLSIAAWRAGQLALKRSCYKEAILYLKLASLLVPDHAPTYYSLSLAYSGNEEFALALEAAVNALQNDLNNTGAFLQQLRSLAKLERWMEVRDVQRASRVAVQIPKEVYLWYALATAHLGEVPLARTFFDKVPPKIRKQYDEVAQTINALIAADIQQET